MQNPRLSEVRKRDIPALNDYIIESIQDKKGRAIVCLDLTKINDAITDYFIICEADSTTQVKAISDHITKNVKDKTGEVPWHTEGYENLEWVLVDYVNVVVHIFHHTKREFYALEELWSDAVVTTYDDEL